MENAVSKFENRIWLRTLALVLVVLIIFSMYLGMESRILFSGTQYVGRIAEYAASITEDNTGYLTQKRLDRTWSILKSLIRKPKTYDQYEMYASIAIAREDYSGAIQYLKGCIETYTGNDSKELAVMMLRLASLYVITEDYAAALTQLDRTMEKDPGLASAYFMRAEMRMVLGDMDGAAEDVDRYLELDGGSPVIMSSLGQLYENVGHPDKAAECYSLAAENDPHGYVDLARCRIVTGDIKGARSSLETFRIISSEDKNGEVSALYGVCLMDSGEYTEAASEFRKAVEDGYAPAQLMYEQAMMCSYFAGDYEAALLDGGDVLTAKKAASEPLAETEVWIGLCHLMLRQYEEAQDSFQTAMDEDPEREDLRYYLGICAMSLERTWKAIGLFTESIDRGENVTACAYNRALCRYDLGDYTGTRDDLYLVIERDDDPGLSSQARELLSAM